MGLKQLVPEIFFDIKDIHQLTEIRLRAEKCVYFAFSDKRHILGSLLSRKDFDGVFLRLCGGSLYKHEETFTQGYFTDVLGGRCGVAGNVISLNGSDKMTEVTSINIRVPRMIRDAGNRLYSFLEEGNRLDGVILVGRPGCGKTTILRSIAALLAESGRCVCVVDERREFYLDDYGRTANVDILSGYSKWKGIEIALRTLCAEVIICDELGIDDRDERLYDVASSGVPLIASAHAFSAEKLLVKPYFRSMIEMGIFKHYVNIKDDYSQEIGTFD